MSRYMLPGAEPDKWFVAVQPRVGAPFLVGTETGRPFRAFDNAERLARLLLDDDDVLTTEVFPVADQFTGE